MASSIFRVSRTETEGQQSGPATLNKAQEPVKMRVYEDESDVDLSEIGDKEIFAVEEENDLANVYVTDLVQEGNMNPITSNAVARFTGANYSTSEVKTSNTWIDGKPIYRRVLVTTTAFTLGIDWIDIVPYCGSPTLNIRDLISSSNTIEVGAYMKKNGPNSIIWARQGSSISVPVGTAFIIEYTKTTD